ncbi:protein of unknown function [Roseivivax lentus]|uniref:DUF4399 domain-containing protein n=1 Tax=Roseivivax lentus TaxID=633194 RepID=A0A1N7MFB1_9RHOB|nr:DUF4399 domain-containing protein [Roseivivax lentus]SIS84757.1 protein of unknown function [Roseivivax lentus]
MFSRLTTATCLAFSLLAAPVIAQEATPAPEGAELYFISLEDGATVSSPVTVRFGLSGMGVAPAGTEREATGHHHVLVNRAPFGEAEGDDEAMMNGLPADDNHRHFGGGQTQTTLELAPGAHTLQLVLGDAMHRPHDPVVASDQITITVE